MLAPGEHCTTATESAELDTQNISSQTFRP